ncbi:amino acid ABC transporter ATP-binding/permease protein [Streptococcus ruminantium]|uniref:amino acid ABC transporter ATP-binding/permease protein n=1 Tax=Streptococcus ruminantium TaxID=1917441 RepID=UPI0012DE7E55|nr:ABC transporter ATP-binding protein [Streptococcus ruminantium]
MDKEQEQYSTGMLILRLLKSMKHLLSWIGLAVCFAILGQVVTVAIPVILVSLAFAGLAGQKISMMWLVLLLVLALLRGAFRYGEHYFGHYVAFHTLATYRKTVFAKLRRLAPAKLDRQDGGQLLKMISEDIEALEVFFAHTLAPICTGVLAAVGLAIYFGVADWKLALLALLTYVFLAIFIPVWFAKGLESLLYQQSMSRQQYVSYFIEGLKGMKDLLQFQQTEQHFSVLATKSQQVNQQEREVAQTNFMQYTLSFLVVGLSVLGFAGLIFDLVGRGQLDLGRGVELLLAFTSSFAPFLELSRLPLGFKRAMNAGRHVYGLLDEPEAEQTGQQVSVTVDEIVISDLDFDYDERETGLFRELSVIFCQPGIIGLVGKSGAGKSTLMKLIMRWYDWQSGQICLSGIDSRQIDKRHLQGSFAYVPQVPQIFKQTIRENLILGRTDVSDEEILELAEKCYMKERILAAPQGLDTVVQSAGDFSAGESQRLELMRALLKGADCYIFDEPTSNLDSLNEARFIQLIKEYCEGMVFLISHRSSTMACADHILRLEDGQLFSSKEEMVCR